MGRRGRMIALGLLGTGLVAAARARPALERAAASTRTSSAPGARAYDLFGRLFLGGLYERIAADAAERVGGLSAPAVLEIGHGPGGLAVRLARRLPTLRLTGLDIDPAMVELAEARAAREGLAGRVRFVEGDVAALPFGDAVFDLVVSSFSVHHWSDPGAGFGEIRRVLRPGGGAIVYDLHPRWTRFETDAPGLGAAARAGGFEAGEAETVRWPGPLPLVVRLALGVPR